MVKGRESTALMLCLCHGGKKKCPCLICRYVTTGEDALNFHRQIASTHTHKAAESQINWPCVRSNRSVQHRGCRQDTIRRSLDKKNCLALGVVCSPLKRIKQKIFCTFVNVNKIQDNTKTNNVFAS